MVHKDKKLAVLEQLKLKNEPVSLPDLITELGNGYAERSARRWLKEMERDGVVERYGNKRATKYSAVRHTAGFCEFGGSFSSPGVSPSMSNLQRFSFRETPSRSYFSPESIRLPEHVQLPLYLRKPIAYSMEWFESYEPNVTFYIPSEYRSQLSKVGRHSDHKQRAGTYARKIFNRLLIDLSYNSSRLEGNTYSLLETERLLLDGTGVQGKLEEEKVMILNHKEAIRYLVDTASRLTVNRETICTLHYLLADGLIEARFAGKVRLHPVRIGGSTYIPFEDPKQLEFQLDRIVKKGALISDPYEQSLFLLTHLSYLQAFIDVNKRTARLSANIPLIMSNLVPLSFNDIGREDYISAMIAIYELQDVRPLVDLYKFSYLRTCALYDSTVEALGFDEVRVRYRQERRALIREIILNNLVGLPLNLYISAEIKKLIEKHDQHDFFLDITEDLREMDESRVAGLGITTKQLKTWIKSYKNNK